MSQVSERYAQALFDITNEKKNSNEIKALLKTLAESVTTHADLSQALRSPMLSAQNKMAILKSIFSNKEVPEELNNFFSLLAKNDRIGSIAGIAVQYAKLVDEQSGELSGVVRSAVELNSEEKQSLKKAIEAQLSKKVNLSYIIDKKLIGGFEARVGNYIFEDSVKSHMQKLNDFITRRT